MVEQKIAALCFHPVLCSFFPSVRSVSFLFPWQNDGLQQRDYSIRLSIRHFGWEISHLLSLALRRFVLETRHNPDPDNKLVYAVADGQYTYGPLSYYQYQNDEKYAKTPSHRRTSITDWLLFLT